MKLEAPNMVLLRPKIVLRIYYKRNLKVSYGTIPLRTITYINGGVSHKIVSICANYVINEPVQFVLLILCEMHIGIVMNEVYLKRGGKPIIIHLRAAVDEAQHKLLGKICKDLEK
jgi:hypothetical protein